MIFSLKKIIFCALLCVTNIGFSQILKEVSPPEYIQTVVFKGPTDDQIPIVKLGEPIVLSFDDLRANESDYYYRVIHCNYDWSTSSLLKSEYLNGYDNERITEYKNSYNTLKQYSNYQLKIPNESLSLKASGNYLLEIVNPYDEIVFSRKFFVYENSIPVGVEIKRSRDFEFINTKQNVVFTLFTQGLSLTQPNKEIKIAILKNTCWEADLSNLKPQYNTGDKLIYKYDQETSFNGGNEFLNFDTKDIKSTQGNIARVALTDLYEHQLYTNISRSEKPYTYFPDINGDFLVRSIQGYDSNIEADYSRVHFSLTPPNNPKIKAIYVVGKFNNYQLNASNKMIFDAENQLYYTQLLFKQGFYNYRYEAVDERGEIIPNAISGSFHVTENQYHVLVYYRGFGSVYDRIIGIGNANSSLLNN